MQPNQVSVRSAPSRELLVKPPQVALTSSEGGPDARQAQWRPAPAISCALRRRSPAVIQALGNCIAARTHPRGSPRCFCRPPQTSQSLSRWRRAVTDTRTADWQEGTLRLPDGCATPARQQSQLTSTSTNRAAVHTVLCELAFSSFYYGKHGSFR